MTEEYINKTRKAVNLLTHIFSEDTALVASVLSYQAEGNTEALIDNLYGVLSFIEELIKELENI